MQATVKLLAQTYPGSATHKKGFRPPRLDEHWGGFDGLDGGRFSDDKPPPLQGEERSGNGEDANRGHSGERHLVLVNSGRQRLEGGALAFLRFGNLGFLGFLGFGNLGFLGSLRTRK